MRGRHVSAGRREVRAMRESVRGYACYSLGGVEPAALVEQGRNNVALTLSRAVPGHGPLGLLGLIAILGPTSRKQDGRI